MFSDRLITSITQKRTYLCLGLDPVLERLPRAIVTKHHISNVKSPENICNAIYEFNCGIIDACAEFSACVKPQIAFYEKWGHKGYELFEKTVKYAKDNDLMVLADAKRNDISSTAKAYADAFFGDLLNVEALTVTPYLGSNGILPFLEYKNKGIFVLLRTSNPSSEEVQLLNVDGEPLYIRIAGLIKEWGEKFIGDSGYSSVGAVVGGTYPEEAKIIRAMLPNTMFLVPGVGAQGGSFDNLPFYFNKDKQGAIINASRDINYAFEKDNKDYKTAASKKAKSIRDKINEVLTV